MRGKNLHMNGLATCRSQCGLLEGFAQSRLERIGQLMEKEKGI